MRHLVLAVGLLFGRAMIVSGCRERGGCVRGSGEDLSLRSLCFERRRLFGTAFHVGGDLKNREHDKKRCSKMSQKSALSTRQIQRFHLIKVPLDYRAVGRLVNREFRLYGDLIWVVAASVCKNCLLAKSSGIELVLIRFCEVKI